MTIIMNPKLNPYCLVAVLAFTATAFPQSVTPVTLLIDVQNHVEYQDDISDVTKFATVPALTPAVDFRTFSVATVVADVVAVNGQPAKGVYTAQARALGTSPTASAGNAIADVQRAALREEVIEILNADGTSIGTISSLGLSGGAPPPGAPSSQTAANFAIVGGTGAFLGARGVSGSGPSPEGVPARSASTQEDPAQRRVNGGGVTRRVLTIYPMESPQILAIAHSSDFTLVSTAKPAVPGEYLSIIASGLGPTKQGPDPGKPFPSSPLAQVNSPVAVTLNGTAVSEVQAVGYPGTVDGYQVNFQVPGNFQAGSVVVQLSAAWIPSATVTIPVQ
jgi:hypothetical protein